nr:hypothetical protein [Tanacetum cinerariifolium]
MHQEMIQQEKLRAVKARLNFEEVSQHSKSETPSRRRDSRKRLGSRHVRSISGSPEQRRGRSESPRKKGEKEKGMFTYSNDSRRHSYYSCRRDTESCYQSSHNQLKIENFDNASKSLDKLIGS